jgi:hypothetical protein
MVEKHTHEKAIGFGNPSSQYNNGGLWAATGDFSTPYILHTGGYGGKETTPVWFAAQFLITY